jgi:hypothetical protein
MLKPPGLRSANDRMPGIESRASRRGPPANALPLPPRRLLSWPSFSTAADWFWERLLPPLLLLLPPLLPLMLSEGPEEEVEKKLAGVVLLMGRSRERARAVGARPRADRRACRFRVCVCSLSALSWLFVV